MIKTDINTSYGNALNFTKILNYVIIKTVRKKG
jgi:hypothetical protein